MKRRWPLVCLLVAVGVAGVIFAVPLLRHNAQGLLRGEPFADGAAPGYWIHVLAQGSPEEREQAVAALGEVGSPEAIAALSAALRDDSYIVRRLSAEALGRLGAAARPVASSLVQAASDPDARVRVAVARALGRIEAPPGEVLPALTGLAQHERDAVTRAAAIASLGSCGAEAVPVLMDCLELPATFEADAGEAARGALQRIGAPAVPALMDATASVSARHRALAVHTLAGMGADARPAAPALEPLLTDPDPLVRVRAASALWQLDGRVETTLPVFIDVLPAADALVQGEALAAIGALGVKAAPAVAPVGRCLQANDEVTRRLAAQTLARIGRPAKEAIAELEVLARDDPQPDVRQAARAAVQSLAKE